MWALKPVKLSFQKVLLTSESKSNSSLGKKRKFALISFAKYLSLAGTEKEGQ
jgi:hypothetical protein